MHVTLHDAQMIQSGSPLGLVQKGKEAKPQTDWKGQRKVHKEMKKTCVHAWYASLKQNTMKGKTVQKPLVWELLLFR